MIVSFSKKSQAKKKGREKRGKKSSTKLGRVTLLQKKFGWRKDKRYHLSQKKKKDFVTLLADLLGNGFTLQESLIFMKKILLYCQDEISFTQRNLKQGNLIYQCFHKLGFGESYVAQLRLSEVHGNLEGTLTEIGEQILNAEKKKEQMKKALTYPMILISFLMGMMVMMKWLLLPQLASMTGGGEDEKKNIGLLVIEYGPTFFLGIVVIGGLVIWLGMKLLEKRTAIFKMNILCKLPFVKVILRYSNTSFFASEWGKLLKQGLEMRQVVEVMKEDGATKLMREVAVLLESSLEQGIPIDQQLNLLPFFLDGLGVIVQQGEAKGKLGAELTIYGQRLWVELNKKSEKWLVWLQPVVFLVVAVLIVCVYGAMLLPIYDGMNGVE